jgi:hypothetical protein
MVILFFRSPPPYPHSIAQYNHLPPAKSNLAMEHMNIYEHPPEFAIKKRTKKQSISDFPPGAFDFGKIDTPPQLDVLENVANWK